MEDEKSMLPMMKKMMMVVVVVITTLVWTCSTKFHQNTFTPCPGYQLDKLAKILCPITERGQMLQ
jgi:hypothetical protein